jgi:serine/threonine protein kinase/tetratricopeptide (TPR) repeat protein
MPDSSPAESLFFAALERPAGERAAFLDAACRGDPDLRARIEKMLAAQSDLGDFLGQPVAPPELHLPTVGAHPPSGERPGAVLAGKYRLTEPIGEGGMGAVWSADQLHPVTRAVAVKLIRGEYGESRDILARFEAERQAIARMDHPHIAKLLDAGTTGEAEALTIGAGRPYFVMELVDGDPLNEYCDAYKLTVPDRLRLFVQVCRAVQHAHQKGIIHRDLKPSNILVEHHDGRPVPRVIDFGLAKATGGVPLTADPLLTRPGHVAGTPLYMAPEQADHSADIDTRADVYALGVNLYELLTGTTPIERDRLKRSPLLEILHVIRDSDPPIPSKRLSSAATKPAIAANRRTEPARLGRFVRGDLDWIVMKALARERERRYDSAAAFAADVERFLNHEPVLAGPPSVAYRLRKFVRRNRVQAVAAGLVLLALLLGITGTTLGFLEANRLAEAERRARIDANDQKEKAEQAAAAEKVANEQTQKRLAQIERGVEVIAGMLVGINPKWEDKGGPPLYDQLRERAEAAADQLQAEAVGDPQAEARLQTLLGETLRALGSYTKAIEVLERAGATRERVLGADNRHTLATRHQLATTYRAAGRTADAITLYERVRDAQVRTIGADDLDTLATSANLAGAYLDAGRTADAITLYKRAGEAQIRKIGAGHPDTLTTLSNLAGAFRVAGRQGDAIALLEQIRDTQVLKLGATHPHTLITLHNLAASYRDAGRTNKAIDLLEQVRDTWIKTLGADHPATLLTLAYLGATYHDAGRTTDALALLERVRDAQVPKLGRDHPHTISTLQNLATVYSALKRYDQSVPLFEHVLARQEKVLGRGHRDTLGTIASLGMNYRDAGRLEEAIPLLEEVYRAAKTHPVHRGVGSQLLVTYWRAGKSAEAAGLVDEVLADIRKLLPADSPQLAVQLYEYGRLLLEVKRYTDAEPLFRESVAILEKKQPDVWATFSTMSRLGGALLGQKKYDEAEPLLLKGYEGMKAREKTIPPQAGTRIPEALDLLVELYTATNKPDELAKWRAERAKYPFVAPPPRAK